MSYTNDTKNMSSKCQLYLLAIAKLINEHDRNLLQHPEIKCHFLAMHGITNEFLTGCRPSEPEPSIGSATACKQFLKIAVWDFYQVFDLNKYLNCQGCPSDIERVVWAKFKELYKNWSITKFRIILHNNKEKDDKIKEAKARGHKKRQAKEIAQMLILGDGDINVGRDKFVNRMHIQKQEKIVKDSQNVSLSLEKAFSEWLLTEEAKKYSEPMKCCAPSQFRNVNTETLITSTSSINLKVNSISGLHNSLHQLSKHPESSSVAVTATLAWDEKIPFSNPSNHICIVSSDGLQILPHKNNDRIIQNQKINITGCIGVCNEFYVVTSNESSAYRLFPPRFEKLEYQNPMVCGKVKNLLRVDNSLNSLILTLVRSNNIKYVININILPNGKDSVDVISNLFSPPLTKIQLDTLNRIEIKTKEQEERNESARLKGLAKSKLEKSEYNNIDKLERLCKMFKNGLLTDDEFKKSKDHILS